MTSRLTLWKYRATYHGHDLVHALRRAPNAIDRRVAVPLETAMHAAFDDLHRLGKDAVFSQEKDPGFRLNADELVSMLKDEWLSHAEVDAALALREVSMFRVHGDSPDWADVRALLHDLEEANHDGGDGDSFPATWFEGLLARFEAQGKPSIPSGEDHAIALESSRIVWSETGEWSPELLQGGAGGGIEVEEPGVVRVRLVHKSCGPLPRGTFGRPFTMPLTIKSGGLRVRCATKEIGAVFDVPKGAYRCRVYPPNAYFQMAGFDLLLVLNPSREAVTPWPSIPHVGSKSRTPPKAKKKMSPAKVRRTSSGVVETIQRKMRSLGETSLIVARRDPPAGELRGKVPSAFVDAAIERWSGVGMWELATLASLQPELRASGELLSESFFAVGRHAGQLVGFRGEVDDVCLASEEAVIPTGQDWLTWWNRRLEEEADERWRSLLSSKKTTKKALGSDAILALEARLGVALPSHLKDLLLQVGPTRLLNMKVEDFTVETLDGQKLLRIGGTAKRVFHLALDGEQSVSLTQSDARMKRENLPWECLHQEAQRAPRAPARPSKETQRLKALIAEREELNPYQRSSMDDVRAASASYRIRFPEDYIDFCLEIGAVDWPMRIRTPETLARTPAQELPLVPITELDGAWYGFRRSAPGIHRFSQDEGLVAVDGSFGTWMATCVKESAPD